MPDNPLAGVELTSVVRTALTHASARRDNGPLNTVKLLQAAIAVDNDGDWAWVQVHTRPLQDDDGIRYVDDGELIPWEGARITRQAFDGLAVAARIAQKYDLSPMPPGVLALGALWAPAAGAARALRDGSELSHGELLNLVQDAVLGMRLEPLGDAVAEPAPAVADDPAPTGDLQELLRTVARRVGAEQVGATYVTISTTNVLLALIATQRAVWEKAAGVAHISLDAYEANLRWAASHPTEVISEHETELDRKLVGIRLTEQLATAIDGACRAATAIAGTERPDVLRMLPMAILAASMADAARGLRDQERTTLSSALVTASLGGTVPDLNTYFSVDSPAPTRAKPEEWPVPPPPRAQSAGFRIGTFIGALIVMTFGGMSFGLAFGLAWLVQFFGARTRRKPASGKILGLVSALVVLVAVGLAVTAAPDFTDDVKAVDQLKEGRAAIDRRDPVAALPLIGGVNLLQNESVSGRILSACIAWDLKFRDNALNDLQMALNLGFEPEESSHYRGRSCFVDTPLVSGIDYLKADGPAGWLVFPRPHTNDQVGQRLLEIATTERTREWTESHLALACLADRYDMRMLAGFYLTVSLNTRLTANSGPTAYPEIRNCLKGDMAKRYRSFRVAEADADMYLPADYASRIPSPKRPHPPEDVCWARFPLEGPCNA